MRYQPSPQQMQRDRARLWWAVAAVVFFTAAAVYLALAAVEPSEDLRAGIFTVFSASVTVFIRAILILVGDAQLSSDMMIAAVLASVIGWLVVITNAGAFQFVEAQLLILSVSMTMLLVALILLLSS